MKFRKMASVLLAASLLIGCAAAENRSRAGKCTALSNQETAAAVCAAAAVLVFHPVM